MADIFISYASEDRERARALATATAELVLNVARPQRKGFDHTAVSAVQQSLETKARNDPGFWSAAGLIEVQVYEALTIRTFASVLAKIDIELRDLHSLVSASWMCHRCSTRCSSSWRSTAFLL